MLIAPWCSGQAWRTLDGLARSHPDEIRRRQFESARGYVLPWCSPANHFGLSKPGG